MNNKFWRWIPGIIISGISLFILSRFINISELSKAIGKFTLANIIVFIILILIPLSFTGFGLEKPLAGYFFKRFVFDDQ